MPQFGPSAGTLYLLTGTSFARIKKYHKVQSKAGLKIEIIGKGDTLSVPNSLWTAGCCVRKNGLDTKSFAVIGNNDKHDSLTQQVTVEDLQTILTDDVNYFKLNKNIGLQKVELFPGNIDCSSLNNNLGQLWLMKQCNIIISSNQQTCIELWSNNQIEVSK